MLKTKNALHHPDSIFILVNNSFPLPKNYHPKDMIIPKIPFDSFPYSEKKLMRAEAAHALEHLFTSALHDKIFLCGISGYRSYQRQQELYCESLKKNGPEHAKRFSALPGCSEHQTGLAIDISAASVDFELEQSFGDTKEGVWLAEHAPSFGFVLRYPKQKEHITGYAYEPWHLRFLGRPLSIYLKKENLVLEEYAMLFH